VERANKVSTVPWATLELHGHSEQSTTANCHAARH
jgi:hypothetical protein